MMPQLSSLQSFRLLRAFSADGHAILLTPPVFVFRPPCRFRQAAIFAAFAAVVFFSRFLVLRRHARLPLLFRR